jgi:hypothetical protein
MRGWLLGLLGLSACFHGEFLEGTVCRSDAECRPRYLCIFPDADPATTTGGPSVDPNVGVCGTPEPPPPDASTGTTTAATLTDGGTDTDGTGTSTDTSGTGATGSGSGG